MDNSNIKVSIIGKQFAGIIPLRKVSESSLNFPFYECKCVRCGKILPEVEERDIINFRIRCCNECDRNDLTGMRFGKLTALELKLSSDKNGYTIKHWLCKCDCGNTKIIREDSLKLGLTKSCGCIKHYDLVGRRFGHLSVIRELGVSPDKTKRYYVCKCDCGKTVIAIKGNLVSGHTTSCGSCARMVDLTGMKFGKLTPLYVLDNKRSGTSRIWHCKCDCGKFVDVPTNALREEHTRSCGCLRDDNTKFRTPEEKRLSHIHYLMLRRCYNEKSTAFKWYGGRGIKVCDEWRADVFEFIRWALSNGYANDLTLDRINVDGNYEPSNCRWVTMKIQANNKTTNKLVTVDGETLTISQWSERVNVPMWKLWGLLNKNGSEFLEMVIRNIINKR